MVSPPLVVFAPPSVANGVRGGAGVRSARRNIVPMLLLDDFTRFSSPPVYVLTNTVNREIHSSRTSTPTGAPRDLQLNQGIQGAAEVQEEIKEYLRTVIVFFRTNGNRAETGTLIC